MSPSSHENEEPGLPPLSKRDRLVIPPSGSDAESPPLSTATGSRFRIKNIWVWVAGIMLVVSTAGAFAAVLVRTNVNRRERPSALPAGPVYGSSRLMALSPSLAPVAIKYDMDMNYSGIKWNNWGSSTATGVGTADAWRSLRPDGSPGVDHIPATFTATHIRSRCGMQVYLYLTITQLGEKPWRVIWGPATDSPAVANGAWRAKCDWSDRFDPSTNSPG